MAATESRSPQSKDPVALFPALVETGTTVAVGVTVATLVLVGIEIEAELVAFEDVEGVTYSNLNPIGQSVAERYLFLRHLEERGRGRNNTYGSVYLAKYFIIIVEALKVAGPERWATLSVLL